MNLVPLFDRLAQDFGLGPEWELVVVADGSGSIWSRAAGWAGIWFCRNTGKHGILVDGQSAGTNYLAEVLAPWMTLVDYHERHGRQRGNQTVKRVAFLSDSISVVNVGAAHNRANAIEDVWYGFRVFMAVHKYVPHFVHVHRQVLEVHTLADILSVAGRNAIEGISGQNFPDLEEYLGTQDCQA